MNIKSEIRNEVFRTTLAVVACVLALSSTVFAANFTSSLALPPGGNPPALVNEGVTYQEKSGGFWADAIGVDDGYCIGNDCITSWPWEPEPATCQIDTKIRQGNYPWPAGTDPGGSSPVGNGCTLSASEVAEGWILSAWDHCSWVASRDCAGPSWCKFTKLTCSGSVVVVPGTLYRGSPYAQQGGGAGGSGGGELINNDPYAGGTSGSGGVDVVNQ